MNLAAILEAANAASAPRTAKARTSTPRQPSLASRFLADLADHVAAQPELKGREMELTMLVDIWAAENHPATPDAKTPEATVSAQLATLRTAGALPTGVTITTAKDRSTAGFAHRATITVA